LDIASPRKRINARCYPTQEIKKIAISVIPYYIRN
jgi:hypothetical protein